MATSGTTGFDLNIDDIIQEAYERCAIVTSSGYDLKSARRSLNLLQVLFAYLHNTVMVCLFQIY